MAAFDDGSWADTDAQASHLAGSNRDIQVSGMRADMCQLYGSTVEHLVGCFGHPRAVDKRQLSGISNAGAELTIRVVGPQLLSPST